MKKKLITVAVLLVIALGVVLLVCGINGLLTEKLEKSETYKVLSDAFFVAGVVYLGIGGLLWASDKGAFDGLGYSISSLWGLHKPSGERLNWHKNETYEEYVERKHKPEKKKANIFLPIVGAALLLVAILFIVLWHTAQ